MPFVRYLVLAAKDTQTQGTVSYQANAQLVTHLLHFISHLPHGVCMYVCVEKGREGVYESGRA